MSKPVSGLNVFQNQAGPIPLSQLDSNISALQAAINDTGTYSNYFVDSSGAANQITVTVAPPLTFAYVTGIMLQVKLANTNTSATVNLNANALGNKTVINNDGTNPTIGSLISGSILDLMYDGTSFRLLRQSGTITTGLFGDGSAAAPSISFASDPDTGIYRSGANEVDFTTGGTVRGGFGATFGYTRVPWWLSDGSAGAPGLTFENDPDTGVYRSSANEVDIATNGVFRFGVANTFALFRIQILSSDGSAGSPGYTFENDIDTGFYRDTANQVGIALGGTTAGQFAQGSFTGTLTGFAANPSGTVNWQRFGQLVIVYLAAAISGTSNATTMTMTGIPAAIQPATQKLVTCTATNNSAAILTGVTIQAGSGTWTFAPVVDTGSGTVHSYNTGLFLNSGNKGLGTETIIIYSLV